MTKVHKVIGTCLLLLVGIGCTKQEEVIRDEIVKSEEVYLSFETSFANNQEDDLRVISWRMGGVNGRPSVSLNRNQTDNRHPAVVVIRNKNAQGASTKTYYLEADFYRVGENIFRLGSTNQDYEVRLGKDIYGTEIRLNYSDEWYMMAFFKGSWDKDARTMAYTLESSHGGGGSNWWARRSGETTPPVDQPMILPWTKMIFGSGDEGKLVLAPERESAIKLMGTIISVSFMNEAGSFRSVRTIGLYSNVLSTGRGHYKLDQNNLPPIPAAGVASEAPAWYPDANHTGGYYDSGYKLMRTSSERHTPNLNNRDADHICPMIWAMPMPNTSGAPNRTEVRAQLGQSPDRTKIVYANTIWSSEKMPAHGSTLGAIGRITNTRITP